MPPLGPPDLGRGPSRRSVLAAFPAAAALLVAGCKPPEASIVPYVAMPEGLIPGRPLFFATTLPLDGLGRGVVVESHEGRPTKVHGNPDHPASLGATDPFAEAAVLDLFDPARERTPRLRGTPSGWLAFEGELAAAMGATGQGVRLLTGPMASPSQARQIAALLRDRPGLVWHAIPPERGPFDLGEAPLRVAPDLSRCAVVVSLGSDLLGPGPDQIAAARAWSQARSATSGAMRLHVFEPSPTLTGAKADRRTGASRADLATLARWLGGDGDPAGLPEHLREGAAAARADLRAAGPGRALVLGAPDLPSSALWRLNAALGAPLTYRASPDRMEDLGIDLPEPGTPQALVDAMAAGEVSALVVLDADPVHQLPRALGFEAALARVDWTASATVAPSDTAAHCRWSLPLAHPFEDWSDLRGPDGTVGLVQPMIAPLFESRSRHEILGAMAGGPQPGAGAREIVVATWAAWQRARGEAAEGPDFDAFWMRALQDGLIRGTATPESTPDLTGASADPGPPASGGFELSLRPSGAAWTGAQAGNAWLQECPEPLTKQVWGNALWMAPKDALDLGLTEGDGVRVTSPHGMVEAPVVAVPGQRPGTLALTLGYGRRQAGPVGTAVGVDAAPLLPPDGARVIPGVQVAPLGWRLPLVRTQTHFEEMGRDAVRTVTPEAPRTREAPPEPSFHPGSGEGQHAWAMVIDLDLCIGCNACVVACQSENNIPVVGPEEVARGRTMHWMRVDAYREDDGRAGFQPVPCMHCQKAPCEPVCPVAASVHDDQGLNVQVYNRCVGTRFCQANCPYKVRHFNFFDYAGTQAFADQGSDLLAALRNPDVTVRAGGVMEKCTYCVQRIEESKIDADRRGEPLAADAVRTACQEACPSTAIRFGDRNHPEAEVRAAQRDPRHYALLGELGTEPRTTYLARVDASGDGSHA